MLRFAQHDRMSEKYDFEKVLGSNTSDSDWLLTSPVMRQTISAAHYSRKCPWKCQIYRKMLFLRRIQRDDHYSPNVD